MINLNRDIRAHIVDPARYWRTQEATGLINEISRLWSYQCRHQESRNFTIAAGKRCAVEGKPTGRQSCSDSEVDSCTPEVF